MMCMVGGRDASGEALHDGMMDFPFETPLLPSG